MNQIISNVFYLKRDALYEDTKPYFCYVPPQLLNGAPVTNQEYVPYDVSIACLRGQEHDFTLGKNGFEVANQPLDARYSFQSPQEDAALMTEYERETETPLKQKLGAERVVVFDEEASPFNLYLFSLMIIDHGAAKKEKSGIPQSTNPAFRP